MRMTFLGAIARLTVIAIGVSACGDGGSGSPGGAGGTSSSAGGTTSSQAGGGGSAGGSSTAGTGGAVTGGAGGTTTTTTGPTYGYCTKPCGNVTDCCPVGSPDCPSNMYPNNYQCADGACLSPECMSTADCTAVDPNQDCLTLSGFHTCVTACTGDGDCTAPATCAGADDDGKKYCTVAGGGCTDDASCNGFGKCVDKVCVCAADADCTFQGFTKCAL